jgi:hypothetical protein
VSPSIYKKVLRWYYKGSKCFFHTVKLLEKGFTWNEEEKGKRVSGIEDMFPNYILSMENLVKETLEHFRKKRKKNQQLDQEVPLKDEYSYQELASSFR